MSLSHTLWQRLPDRFLKMGYRAWAKLDDQIKLLIVELAEKQNFKCAHCSETRSLVIEHDHYPEEGPGDKKTIYNIRGLVCHGCNWHLGLYEKDERGEDREGWDHVDCWISSQAYETYIYVYECRVGALLEELREQRMGSLNYWRRRCFLDKFDEWAEYGGSYPWYWGFEEVKAKRHGPIRTPMQFIKGLMASMRYVVEEAKKDPNYRPPEDFIKLMVRIKPLMDSIRPTVEARMKAIAGGIT
jgi:hypothetical protein